MACTSLFSSLLILQTQDCHEGLLRDLDGTDHFHALLARLLVFEQFALAVTSPP